MTQARASHLRLVTNNETIVPTSREPRLRFKHVVRLEDGASFGLQAETDTSFEDAGLDFGCNYSEASATAGEWLGNLIERTARLARDLGHDARPISILAPFAALTDPDAPMAAEAGAYRANVLPQEIRIDFVDASLATLEDLAMDRIEAFRARGFRIGLDARKTWHTPMSARARMTLEAILVDPRTLKSQDIPVSRLEIAAAEGVAIIAQNAKWRDGEELAAIGVNFAVAPGADA